ncbi:MAG: hypothetical protein QW549_02635 [Candidatus Micrarchaeaceae archaeon]
MAMLALGLVLLSVGAINMLIPIIIIIILIGAAGASMRGMSIFDFFGVSVLFGIGTHGKGTLAKKNVYKMGYGGGKGYGFGKFKAASAKTAKVTKKKLKTKLQNRKQKKQIIAEAKSMGMFPVMPPQSGLNPPRGASSPLYKTKQPTLGAQSNTTQIKPNTSNTVRMAIKGGAKVARIKLNPKLNPTNPVKRVLGAAVEGISAASLASRTSYMRNYREKKSAAERYEGEIDRLKMEIAHKSYSGESTKNEEKELGNAIKRSNALKGDLESNKKRYEHAATYVRNKKLLNKGVASLTGVGVGLDTAIKTMKINWNGANAYPSAKYQAIDLERAKVARKISGARRVANIDTVDDLTKSVTLTLNDITDAATKNNIMGTAGLKIGERELNAIDGDKQLYASKSITGEVLGERTGQRLRDYIQEHRNAIQQIKTVNPQLYDAMHRKWENELKRAEKFVNELGPSLESAQLETIRNIQARLSDINKAAGGNVGANELNKLATYRRLYESGIINEVDFVAYSNLIIRDLVEAYKNEVARISSTNPSLYLRQSREWEKALKKAEKPRSTSVEGYFLKLTRMHKYYGKQPRPK